MNLLPFQTKFLHSALRPDIDTAVLSVGRGNGKTSLAGHVLARALDPDDELHRPGTESVLMGPSIEACRLTFNVVRSILEPRGGYRFLDSATRCAITHRATGTRLRVVGSNGKTAMGLLNCPYVVLDEPGAMEIRGGQLLWAAVRTAQGKPGSPLKAVIIGTLAPFAVGPGHWFYDLAVGGSRGRTHVTLIQGDPARWDEWPNIRRANPLTRISHESCNKRRPLMA